MEEIGSPENDLLLKGNPNGTFYISQDSSLMGSFQLCVIADSLIKSFSIVQSSEDGRWMVKKQFVQERFVSLDKLVEYYKRNSGLETYLSIPCPRVHGQRYTLYVPSKYT